MNFSVLNLYIDIKSNVLAVAVAAGGAYIMVLYYRFCYNFTGVLNGVLLSDCTTGVLIRLGLYGLLDTELHLFTSFNTSFTPLRQVMYICICFGTKA